MVGDSLHHDILGANGAAIDSCFIEGGVHNAELEALLADGGGATAGGVGEGGADAAVASAVDVLGERHGAQPTYTMPLFQW